MGRRVLEGVCSNTRTSWSREGWQGGRHARVIVSGEVGGDSESGVTPQGCKN